MARTMLQAGGVSDPAAAATVYGPVGVGLLNESATEADRQIALRAAGTCANLAYFLSANDRGTGTVTFRKNTANGNQTLSITSSTTGVFSDLTHSDTIAAGDLVAIQRVTGAGGTTSACRFGQVTFDATTNTYTQWMISNGPQGIALQLKNYFPVGDGVSGNSTGVRTIQVRTAGTVKNLYYRITGNTRTGASTFTSRKNLVAGALTVSIPATTTGTFEDTVNSDSLVAGDAEGCQVPSGAAGGLTGQVAGFGFETTTDDSVMFDGVSSGSATTAASTTFFFRIASNAAVGVAFNTTEANEQTPMPYGATVANLGIYILANARTATTCTIRNNGADSALTCSVTASTTGWFEDTTDLVNAAGGDLINHSIVTGTGTASMTVGGFAVQLTALASSSVPSYRVFVVPSRAAQGRSRW